MRLNSKWATESDDEDSRDQTVDCPNKKSFSKLAKSSQIDSKEKNSFKSAKNRLNKSKLVSKWDDDEQTPKEINFRSVNQVKEQESKHFAPNIKNSSLKEPYSNRYNKRNTEDAEKLPNNSLFDRIAANKHPNRIQRNQFDNQNGSITAYESSSDNDETLSNSDSEGKPLENLSDAAKAFAQRLGVKVDEKSIGDNINKHVNSHRNPPPNKNTLLKPFQHDGNNYSRKSPRKSQKSSKTHPNDHQETSKHIDSDSKIDKKAYEALLSQVNSLKFQNEQLEKIISDSKISLIPEPSSGSWADWGDEE